MIPIRLLSLAFKTFRICVFVDEVLVIEPWIWVAGVSLDFRLVNDGLGEEVDLLASMKSCRGWAEARVQQW